MKMAKTLVGVERERERESISLKDRKPTNKVGLLNIQKIINLDDNLYGRLLV